MKLCTAMICSVVSQQNGQYCRLVSIELSYISQSHYVAQLKCLVGTAGGSLGVFTVTRRNVGEPLQLEETGNFVCMY